VPQIPFVSTAEVNTFVDRKIRPTVVDQRFKAKPVLGILRGKNRIVEIDGGSIIAQPVLAQPNQTAITYQGADILPTDAQEEFTSAEVPWKQATVAVTITGLDKLRTSGKERQLDYVATKVESAYMSLFNLMGIQVFADGTGNSGKDWDGIGAGVNNAAGFQVYLGIDRAANQWWQAQVFDPGVLTPLNTASMMTLFTQCQTDEERPNLISATKTGYSSFWGFLTPGETFVDSEVATLGFENIGFQGVVMVMDSSEPANTMHFLNLDHLQLLVHRDENFDFSGFDKPINQNIETAHVFVTGNFVLRKPSSCGVLRNIANG
jgi:hypothetical protein